MSKKANQQKRRSRISAGEWALWGTILVVALIALGIFLLNRQAQSANPQQPTPPVKTLQATLIPQALPTQVTSQAPAQPTAVGAIGLDQAFVLYQNKTYFLDVRSPADFAMYRIPNSVSIPLAELESRIGEVPTDRDVVIVCLLPEDCLKARDILMNAGLSRLFPMSDSIETWVLSGHPFEGNFPD